ncbi:hypothetical protein DFH28DRAFT_893875 [Melampsora americana]|nr:hypothetical protein DFH28DRAFT_893875 [Melampsora americana]
MSLLDNPTASAPQSPSTPADSKSVTLAGLSKFNIAPLNSPGSHFNYLDWSFVAEVNLEAAKLDYVLTPLEPKSQPATWATNFKPFYFTGTFRTCSLANC